MGLFERLKQGLRKTRESLVSRLDDVFSFHQTVDDDLFEELEEVLITSDISVQVVMEILEKLRERADKERIAESAQLYNLLKEELLKFLPTEAGLQLGDGLNVILVVGVNGVGKTTTIGKLAHLLKKQGHRVILAAADTFRAAAADQLTIWANRVGVEIIKHQPGADPSAVVYDTIQAARARKADVVIVDTAGRLHNKKNLMNEVAKIRRIIAREVPGAPQETLLVVDATTGQNGLHQAQAFHEAVDLSGIVLTKLDGTAKGGIVLSIAHDFSLPVKFVGVGEKLDDLQPFAAEEFVAALFDK